MPHLLHLDSSGRADGSVTRVLTRRFADAWRAHHPGAPVTYRDLVASPVPHLDAAASAVLWVPEDERDPGQAGDWAPFEELLREVEAADTVLVGAPMHNFGVPSALKAWLDRVAGVPGRSFTPGIGGLLSGRRVVVVTARGGAYTPGTPRAPFDFQEPYLRAVFSELMGLTDVEFVHAEMTNARVFPALAAFTEFEDESRRAAEAALRASAVRPPAGVA